MVSSPYGQRVAEERLAVFDKLNAGFSVNKRQRHAGQREITGNRLGVLNDCAKAAGVGRTDSHNAHKRNDHNHSLHEVRSAFGKKAAKEGVDNDKNRAGRSS